MDHTSDEHHVDGSPATPEPDGGEPLKVGKFPSLPFLLPLVVYMLVGVLEVKPPKLKPELEQAGDGSIVEKKDESIAKMVGLEYEDYPKVYTVKIGLTVLALLFCLPTYLKFPFKISGLAILVGVVGVVVWIGICKLGLEHTIFPQIGMESFVDMGERPAYNPLEQLGATPSWAYGFLAIRFFGLVILVPIIEEFFLRAWLMRFVIQENWWDIPFGHVTPLALAVGIAFPALYHSAEFFAALVWFGMVTWLMVRTKNIWDCVAAHAVTNLLLGIYVVSFGQWQLW